MNGLPLADSVDGWSTPLVTLPKSDPSQGDLVASAHIDAAGANADDDLPARPTRPARRRESLAVRVARRGFDLAVSLIVLTFGSPLLLLGALAQATGTVVVERRPAWGWRRRPMPRWVPASAPPPLAAWLLRRGYPRLLTWQQVFLGRLSVVGPRWIGPDEADAGLCSPGARPRFRVKPGLVGLAHLRRQANIDFAPELADDLEYLEGRSLRGDLGIALRSLWAGLWGNRRPAESDSIELLGFHLWNVGLSHAVAEAVRVAAGSGPAQRWAFLNADCVNLAARGAGYREALVTADRLLADGIGMKLAGQVLGSPVRQNLCGTDLFPRLCDALQGRPQGLFLLGARPGVAEAVAAWVARTYPAAQVKGYHHGYFSDAELPAVLESIRNSGAEILLVAFGAPRQDLWIAEHLPATGVRLAMGVGGLLDFYSGRIPRAPQWVRELSLEWAYRLYQEPGRLWRRYVLGNTRFLFRVARAAWASRRRSSQTHTTARS